MNHQLKKLKLHGVAFVADGANQEAHITFAKDRDVPQERIEKAFDMRAKEFIDDCYANETARYMEEHPKMTPAQAGAKWLMTAEGQAFWKVQIDQRALDNRSLRSYTAVLKRNNIVGDAERLEALEHLFWRNV